MSSAFPTTSWNLIALAAQPQLPEGREALATFCGRYHEPVYAFLRRRGADAERAWDLTQGFFTRLIDKNTLSAADRDRGRFRTFLLACVKHYAANVYQAEQIRPEGHAFADLDAALAEERYASLLSEQATAEQLYDRALALSLLEEALTSLDDAYTHKRPEQRRRYELLRPRLDGSEDPRSHEEVAHLIGAAVGAVRTATSRLYDEYQDQLRAVVTRHFGPEADVEAEMAWIRATIEDLP